MTEAAGGPIFCFVVLLKSLMTVVKSVSDGLTGPSGSHPATRISAGPWPPETATEPGHKRKISLRQLHMPQKHKVTVPDSALGMEMNALEAS